jgi:SAM-dependent methyltransferase
MSNPFSASAMAEGYANSRPPVHARVFDLVRARIGNAWRARQGVDIGCGAGVSTRALAALADRCYGLEPAEAMLRRAVRTVPGAVFVAGTAEALPFRNGSLELLASAGALNYVRLEQFFPEAARVLEPGGALLVYDFSTGRSFRRTTSLDEWFEEFIFRYPFPRDEGCPLDPESLGRLGSGFRMEFGERFETGIPLDREFYLDYLMTETNVAAAVRQGASGAEIRIRCAESLCPIWAGGEREVLFRGYFCWMIRV